MLKALVCLLFFFVTFIIPSTRLLAASEKSYEDYLYQNDQYRLKLNNFKTARSEYIKYKTLLSETTALDTAKSMLVQRNELLRTYILLLTEKLNENSGLTTIDKKLYQTILSTELTYLQTFSTKVKDAATLTDIKTLSLEFSTRYKTFEKTVHQITVALRMGELIQLHTNFKTAFSHLQSIVEINKSHVSVEKQAIIDRWMIQINAKQNLFQQKLEQIIEANGQMDERKDINEFDQETQKLLSDAKTYLSEGTNFISELLTLLQIQDML